MVDKIFLCVYYTFWSILNIFKKKIIFTQNQVRHRPSEISGLISAGIQNVGRSKMSAVQIGGGGNNVGSGNNIVGQLVVATNSSGVATTSSGGMATSEIRQML